MTDQVWHGRWFLPSGLAEARPGTLTVDQTGSIRLRVTAEPNLPVHRRLTTWRFRSVPQFRSAHTRGYPKNDLMSIGDRPVPVIHGVTADGLVTLLNCEQDFQAEHDYIVTASIVVNEILAGALLPTTEDPAFVKMRIELENLLPFMDPDENWVRIGGDTFREATTASNFDLPAVSIAENSVRAVLRASSFQVSTNTGGSAVQSMAVGKLEFTFHEPISYAQKDAIIKPFSDLLTIASGRPNRVLTIELDCADSNIVRVYREPLANSTASSSRDLRYIFTSKDLPFNELIEAWWRTYDKASAAIGLLLVQEYSPNRYSEEKGFEVAVAAESMHAALADYSKLKDGEMDRVRSIVRKELDKGSDLREWALQQLATSRPSFGDRMRDLLTRPDHHAINALMPGSRQDIWINELTSRRNDFAHGNKQERKSGPRQTMILVRETQIVLTLTLMQEVGLSAEVQRRFVEQERLLPFLRERLKLGHS